MDRAVMDLPLPLSPTMPSVSPGADVERNVVYGFDKTIVGGEVRLEITDGKQGFRHNRLS